MSEQWKVEEREQPEGWWVTRTGPLSAPLNVAVFALREDAEAVVALTAENARLREALDEAVWFLKLYRYEGIPGRLGRTMLDEFLASLPPSQPEPEAQNRCDCGEDTIEGCGSRPSRCCPAQPEPEADDWPECDCEWDPEDGHWGNCASERPAQPKPTEGER
jgi:hypothetical protein